MAKKAFRIKSGVLNIKPKNSLPLNIEAGDFYVDISTGFLKENDGTETSELITTVGTQTLEDKTFTTPQINNPTGLNKNDVGLNNVDNTSDLNKPISTAQQSALNNKQPLNTRLTQIAALTPNNDDLLQQDGGVMSSTSLATFKTELALTKSDVGLGNVDNTSDTTQNSATASLSNKTIVEPVIDNYLDINEESEPGTPAAGKIRLYGESDKNLYIKDSNGFEKQITTLGDSTTVSFQASYDFAQITTRPISQFPWSSPQLSNTLNTMPTQTVTFAAWSSNNEFFVYERATPNLIGFAQKKGNDYTLLTNPVTLPTGQVTGAAFSSNSEFVAASHNTSPFVSIYQRSGSTFTKLANPVTLPAGNAQHVSWSNNTQYLTVVNETAPRATVYQRSGTTFTKLIGGGGQFSTTMPSATALYSCWSPDDKWMLIVQNTTPAVLVYEVSGTTFTNISPLPSLPTGVISCEFSPNGKFLALTTTVSPYIHIYSISGNTFTKLSDPVSLPTGSSRRLAWSKNSQYLAIPHSITPFVTIYEVSGITFTKLSDPSTLPAGTGFCCVWDNNTNTLVVGHSSSPYISMYNTNSNMSSNGFLKITKKEKSF